MSKSGQMYYDHQREFGHINYAEQMHRIELDEQLYLLDEKFTREHKL